MNTHTAPDPEFVAHLEWELRTALRRPAAAAAVGRSRSRTIATLVALVVASTALGATATAAVFQLRSGSERALVRQRAELFVQLAERKAEHRALAVANAERRYQSGQTSDQAFLDAQLHARNADAALARARLDLEEAQITGAQPRDHIAAPLVGTHDFVSRRLEIDLAAARNDVETQARLFERASELQGRGVAPAYEVAAAELTWRLAQSQVRLLDDRLALRTRFVAGELSAVEADRLDLAASADNRWQRATLRAETAATELKLVQRMHDAGAVPQTELLRAREANDAAEIEASICKIDRDLLRPTDPRTP